MDWMQTMSGIIWSAVVGVIITAIVLNCVGKIGKIWRKDMDRFLDGWLLAEEDFIVGQNARLKALIASVRNNGGTEHIAWNHVKMLVEIHNLRVFRCSFAYLHDNRKRYPSAKFHTMQDLYDMLLTFDPESIVPMNRCVRCIEGTMICGRDCVTRPCIFENEPDCTKYKCTCGCDKARREKK